MDQPDLASFEAYVIAAGLTLEPRLCFDGLWARNAPEANAGIILGVDGVDGVPAQRFL